MNIKQLVTSACSFSAMLATFTVVSGLISPPRTDPPQSIEKKTSPPPTRTERPHLDLIGPTPA